MNCIKATLPLRREVRARLAQGLSSVQILNMFTSRCRLFTPKSTQKGVLPMQTVIAPPIPTLIYFVWSDFIIFPWSILFFCRGGLFVCFNSTLTYTGKTEKKILYFDLLGMCPRMKNCISPVNFYVKTILHQCNVLRNPPPLSSSSASHH